MIFIAYISLYVIYTLNHTDIRLNVPKNIYMQVASM